MCVPLQTISISGKLYLQAECCSTFFFLTNTKQILLSQEKGRKPTCTKKKIHGFHLFTHVYILSLPDPKTIEVNGEVPPNTYHALIFEQVLRQARSRFCASPYHTPPMNLYANPQVSNSEVSLDEQLVQQTVRCLL